MNLYFISEYLFTGKCRLIGIVPVFVDCFIISQNCKMDSTKIMASPVSDGNLKLPNADSIRFMVSIKYVITLCLSIDQDEFRTKGTVIFLV